MPGKIALYVPHEQISAYQKAGMRGYHAPRMCLITCEGHKKLRLVNGATVRHVSHAGPGNHPVG
ncbi:Uncharacterised protein [Escherichia coli]|nr:Uncharacterised protein [Escherichia coli]